jgi:HAE1 family hydrophobic/amphiphilic exporter-1
VPAGRVGGAPAPDGQKFTFTVQLQGRLRTNEEFERMILRTTPDGGLIRLSDVGRVELGGESFDVGATDLRGVPSVGLAVYQLSGSNALEVSNGVKEVIETFEATLPPGIRKEVIYDNTDFINASIQGVTGALRDAVLLVVLILFLFLQDWKATMVPGIAIPVALVGTFAFVLAFGFSLNQLTLFGLVLAAGLVVDDAITVIEDTSTKKKEGLSAVSAAMATMNELFGAVIATSLVLFAVFLPVLFFPGATGTIYKQFAATILFAVTISTFNAVTFSPMLSALLLARESPPPGRRTYAIAGAVIGAIYGLLLSGGISNPLPILVFGLLGLVLGWFTPIIFRGFNRFYAGFERRYDGALGWALSHRKLVMAVLVGGVVLTGVAFNAIPSGFVPVEDQGYAIGFVQAPDGTSVQKTSQVNAQVAEILRTEKDITAAAIFSGASLDGNAPNRGLFFFGTKNWDDRGDADQSVNAIVERLNRKLSVIDGARVFVVEPPSIPGYGASGGFEFQLLDQSGGALNLPEFAGVAGQLIGKANQARPDGRPLFSRVFTQFSAESPQLAITVDRDRLATLGLDYGQAMRVFSFYFGGAYVNDTFQEGRVRRVYVQADGPFRATPQRLQAIFVTNAKGESVPLAEVITVEPITGPSIIPRFNLFRAIRVEGSAAPGRSSGEAIKGILGLFKGLDVPGIGYDWTGIAREEVSAGALAVVIFALGILVVYMVLAAQYESYSDPLIILMTVPTAMLGALIFLGARGYELNIYAQVGLVMLIGLAAKNGILIVDLANQRMAAGASALEAAREAARSRLRPIIMTAVSSLFGFLPLVFASGAGARGQSSLGTVVFGGLLVATVLSLLVVPVFYVVVKQLVPTATTPLPGADEGTPIEGASP